MTITKFISRINRINDLIRRKATGNPKEFAKKLGISESRLYEIIKELRLLGLSIEYSHAHSSYCYSCNVGIEIKLSLDNPEGYFKAS